MGVTRRKGGSVREIIVAGCFIFRYLHFVEIYVAAEPNKLEFGLETCVVTL